MMKRIMIFILAMLVTSCVTQEKCSKRFPTKCITHVELVYRDTIMPVFINQSPVVIASGREGDTINASSGTAHGSAWVSGGVHYIKVFQTDSTYKMRFDSLLIERNRIDTLVINVPCKDSRFVTGVKAIKGLFGMWQFVVLCLTILCLVMAPRLISKKK